MTIDTLKQILLDGGYCGKCFYIGSDPQKSLIGGINCRPSLLKTKDGYEVFDSERGCRDEASVKHFISEDEACAEFLRLILYFGDYIKSYTLGSIADRDKLDSLLIDLRRNGMRPMVNAYRKEKEPLIISYYISIPWKYHERGIEMAAKHDFDWKPTVPHELY